jgi:hypothetical protein
MILVGTIATVLLQVLAALELCAASARKRHDEALYEYCLHRLLVICPICRVGFEVQDLTEQMNIEWSCECCGTTFREYATHTIARR